MKVALDADVCIYWAIQTPWTAWVRTVVDRTDVSLVGSLLLTVEVLPRPMRLGHENEVAALNALLSRMTLLPVDVETAGLGVLLGQRHGLSAADALHLATAIRSQADVFVTNNKKDFDAGRISEIAIVHPEAA